MGHEVTRSEQEWRLLLEPQEYAVLRPETPAYAVISTTFETAAKDIMNGADVQETLDRAVAEIDANIASNDGYGFQ